MDPVSVVESLGQVAAAPPEDWHAMLKNLVEGLFASEVIFDAEELEAAQWPAELVELMKDAEDLARQTLTENTYRTYKSSVVRYLRFCIESQVPPERILPYTSPVVGAYLRWMGLGESTDEVKSSASTLNVAWAALNELHRICGWERPSTDPKLVRVLDGLQGLTGIAPTNQKDPLTVDLLSLAVDTCRQPRPETVRDRFLAHVLAVEGIGPTRAASLDWTDISLAERHVEVQVDPDNTVRLPKVDVGPDPVRAAAQLAELQDPTPDTPVFTRVEGPATSRRLSKKRLSPQAIGKRVRSWNQRHGMQLDSSAHSSWPSAAVIATVGSLPERSGVDIRDEALLLVGWHSAMRRSNITAIRWCDITNGGVEGFDVFQSRSKTDQTGRGHVHYLVGETDDQRLNPRTAFEAWASYVAETLGISERELASSKNPVFVHVDRTGALRSEEALTEESVAQIVKRRVEAIGEDPARYAGHSLRSGVITSLARDGAQLHEIRKVSLHKSADVLIDYIRAARGSKDSPLHGLMRQVADQMTSAAGQETVEETGLSEGDRGDGSRGTPSQQKG
ncbi:MAG: tyrosine-type recombinase/integrase [Actinomycetota bacterium]